MNPRTIHCSACGAPLDDPNPLVEQVCASCTQIHWVNVAAVAIACVPVEHLGYVLVRRAIKHDPAFDTLNFPGGFIDIGEHWATAACREFREETGYKKYIFDLRLFQVETFQNRIMLFGISAPISVADYETLKPTSEVSQISMAVAPIECGVDLHTKVLKRLLTEKP